MGFLIGFLTFVMVVDCVVLILLVLIQLPKKDAGAGLAFGGGATDALFGAGSGNVLTRITKYTAGIFFVLAIVLAMMQKSYYSRNTTAFEQGLSRSSQAPPIGALPATPSSSATTASTNAPSATPAMPLMTETNLPAKPTAEQPAPRATTTTNSAPAPAAPK